MANSAKVAMSETFGWQRRRSGALSIWTKGLGVDFAPFLTRLISFAMRPYPDRLAAALRGLDGHFGLVIHCDSWTLAATDRVASIPIFWSRVGGSNVVAGESELLRRSAGLDEANVDPNAALSLAMAGYVTGGGTLYAGLNRLGPGQFVLFAAEGRPICRRYWTYRPWLGVDATVTRKALKRRLTDVTLAVLKKLIDRADGRQILVPLSAGIDSRLVLSGLRHLGYRNLGAYTYGLAHNKEVEGARSVAEALDVPWRFIPFTHRSRARLYAEEAHAAYVGFADTCASTPVEHDYASLRVMRSADWADSDAIIVNGQTGDFISGNHIPETLARSAVDADRPVYWRTLRDQFIAKHYALWPGLINDLTTRRIGALLQRNLRDAGAPAPHARTLCGLYEFLEFENRQSTYLINGQRAYEFFGYDWALPLWDNDYLEFWERVPLSAKLGQSLYRDMLMEQNWGGVWTQRHNVNAIAPRWMIPFRFAAKVLCAPYGRANWTRFDRRFLQYWNDLHCKYAVVPYRRVALGPAHRNAISWLTETYLASKGLKYDGCPLTGTPG